MLSNLAQGGEEKPAIAAEDAIPLLVQVLRDYPAGGGARDQAVRALWALTEGSPGNCKAIAVAGAIPLLVPIVADGTQEAKESATAVLTRTVGHGAGDWDAIKSTEVVDVLFPMLIRAARDNARKQAVTVV
jgi:hypothetical protein